MKQSSVIVLIFLSVLALWSCKPNKTFTENEISVIPRPQKMELGQSSFRFKKNTKLVVENVDQEMVARQFAELFKKAAGWDLPVVVGGSESSNQVFFKTETVMGPEAYSLDVSAKRIEVKAAKPAGFFYALQTLRQLLPPAIEGQQSQTGTDWLVPAVSISDAPVFKWRGFMLDVVRHFFPKDSVLRMMDNLALHKINTLHLHLVDDQGWRIEIKKYPRLTEVGAWRVNHEDLPWNSRPQQQPGEKASYGGFYTQDDIREMVAYAQSHFINLVPEIEMPAHVSSALAAYPQFSCKGTPLTVPSGGLWPITDIYCAGNDSTFLFLQEVLTEVIDLFPSKYIHVGGDEATKTEWEKCPKCKKRLRDEKIKNVNELQSYFMTRIEKFINSRDRIMLGWDEILEGGLAPNATVMSWRGMQGGIDAATQGHDVVMTPGSPCYFDHYQGAMDSEPLAIGGYNPLSKVYQFNPVPAELDAQAAKHILGGQANLWTEYVPTFSHAEYMTFPRIAALSEAVWTPAANRDWNDFSRRIQLLMKRYDVLGIHYSKSAFNVQAKTSLDEASKQLQIELTSEFPNSEIHYTTDGTEPTNESPVYEKPVVLSQSATLKAIAFNDGIPVGKTISKSFDINKATFKPVKYLKPVNDSYKGSGDYCLVNGIRGSANHGDGEWQAWCGDNMEVVIDLLQNEEIRNISVGALQNNGAWIFFPKKVEFWTSEDGVKFKKVAESVNDIDPLASGIQLKDFVADFEPVNARYVKVVAVNLGKGPKGHAGEGKPIWIFVDEIRIR